MQNQTPGFPRSLFMFSLLYGGLCVLAGVMGVKLASLGHWPVLGDLAVESGIFAFLFLVILSSAVAELFGQDRANQLVRYGFVPLIVSMVMLTVVIRVVPPASFWTDQDAFAKLLGQGVRMQFAGLISYGTSQTLNVYLFSRIAGGQFVVFGTYPDTPEWSGSVFGEISAPVSGNTRASLRSDYYAQSKFFYTSTGNTNPGAQIAGYNIVNFRLGLDNEAQGWSLAA